MRSFDANRVLNVEEIRAGKVELRSVPLQVNIDLTGRCNVHPPCVYCSGKNFRYDYPSLDLRYIDRYGQILDSCEHINDDSFGEPLLHPGLIGLARRFTSNGQMFSFVTNGLLLNRQQSNDLVGCGPKLGLHISVDAATPDTYFRIKGRDFGTLRRNIRFYVDLYRHRHKGAAPDLTLTFIVMKINRDEVFEFLEFAAGLGVRALLASLHDRPSVPIAHFGGRFIYEDEMLTARELFCLGEEAIRFSGSKGGKCLLQWDRANDSAIQSFAIPGIDIPCLIPWRFFFIQEHRKKAFLCPYHKHPVGDLGETSVEAIWNGKTARRIRSALIRSEIPRFCRNNSAACPLLFAADDPVPEDNIDDRVVMGTNDYRHLDDNWYSLECIPENVRWTRQVAGFRVRGGTEGKLFIECLVCRPDIEANHIAGRVEIEDQVVGIITFDRIEWQVLGFAVPHPRPGGIIDVRIVLDSSWCPAEVSDSTDVRQLGIAVRKIWTE